MLYFAVNTQGVDGGIMVTGSHNPANYNGFKLMLGKKPFFGGDIQRLGQNGREVIVAGIYGNLPTLAARSPERARSVWSRQRVPHLDGQPQSQSKHCHGAILCLPSTFARLG